PRSASRGRVCSAVLGPKRHSASSTICCRRTARPSWRGTAFWRHEEGQVMDAVWPALILSLKVAGWATAVTLLLGVAVGYLLARARFRGRDLLDTLLALPMVMPPTVLGYSLLVLLGRQSAFGAWLQDTFGINLLFTWQGAVIAASVVAFPLVFKPARAAFEAVDGQ